MNGYEVIEDGDLVVVDNRIRALGPRGKVAVPTGARVIDVTGKTIMPGLIDVHAHLWPIWDAHRKVSWEYATSLAYGVTSLRDPQSKRSDALIYADRIDVGDMLGARVFSVGRGVFAQVGLRSLADTRQVLRRYSEHYRTHTIKQYLVGGRLERQWFAMAAQEQRLTPTTEGGKDFKMNLTLILDGYSGLEHWIDTTPLYRDVTELMARSGIAYTLTTNVELDYFYRRYAIHDDAKLRRFMPHTFIDRLPYRARSLGVDDPYLFERHAADAAKIVAAGGRVALGSHGNFPGWGVHWELWATQSGGISPHEGLRVGTLASAEAIGLGRQLGSLESGKLADLLVLDSNPLLDIRATLSIRYVMKNGRLYEGATLDEIWPRSREFGRQSWMLKSRSATIH
ncbi:amidohydrolase family protein [Steroidobacter sp.]|uniref:amidohydrolase family protein n=1 Tax=Steroidobacter sp. TaxID=1978227 RepID=UPI001A4FE95A|nr:amidohydrolase family protein [Steroidobacter sp.]MBL8265990.1 amidohydrolase family protein [Steroidobacter sp.]